jgi:hypothetical protein
MENLEWKIIKNTPTRMDFNSQFSILNSVSRLAFFQPMAMLAADCRGFLRNPRVRTSERSATFSKDLERVVEDRSQFGKDRTAANPATFVVLDPWLRDTHPVHLPVDLVPAKRQRFRRRPEPTVATQPQDHLPNRVGLVGSISRSPRYD